MSGTLQTLPASLTPPARKTQPFAWQGWRMRVPASWNPVALEGDSRKGHALLADLDGPRLGVRWSFIDPRNVTEETLRRVMREEAGDDAAKRAEPFPGLDQPGSAFASLLHLESDPPGRDVFVWWSGASDRLLELVYHTTVRDNILKEEVVKWLGDVLCLKMRPVAVLDLVCRIPSGMLLTSHRLNAGDVSLEFREGRRFVVVRQIALAEMALRRKPLAQWLAEQQRARGPRYRATGDAAPIELTFGDGRAVSGLIGRTRHRLQFLAGACATLALHDETRDRLVLVEASDDALAREVARTVGCDIDVPVQG